MSTAQSQGVFATGVTHPKSLEQWIYGALSPLFSGKVYPEIAPDSTQAPFAVYTTVASTPENTLSSGRPVSNDRVQIDVWATSREQVGVLGQATLAAMDALVTGTFGVYLISSSGSYEADVRLHRVIQDFSISQPRS